MCEAADERQVSVCSELRRMKTKAMSAPSNSADPLPPTRFLPAKIWNSPRVG